jgi:Cof subfamily protein (haloacid dehalogenase superfamily)
MAAPEIKLLLADVDGTLVTKEKILTDQAVAAVRALHAAGVVFAITSGRPPRGMEMLIAPLDLRAPVAGFNGGVLTKPDLTVIETRTLSAEAAHAALRVIAGKGLDAWVYTADDWLLRDKAAAHVDREAWTVKFEPVVVADFTDEQLGKAVKIVGVSDDLDLVASCEAAVQQALSDSASAARSQPYYLDVTNPGANKGAVVGILSDMFGIDPGHIATIGDMPNDVLMFKKSGLSIAMGNASGQVKAQATEVTDSYEDEGFAKAVHRFVLPAANR